MWYVFIHFRYMFRKMKFYTDYLTKIWTMTFFLSPCFENIGEYERETLFIVFI